MRGGREIASGIGLAAVLAVPSVVDGISALPAGPPIPPSHLDRLMALAQTEIEAGCFGVSVPYDGDDRCDRFSTTKHLYCPPFGVNEGYLWFGTVTLDDDACVAEVVAEINEDDVSGCSWGIEPHRRDEYLGVGSMNYWANGRIHVVCHGSNVFDPPTFDSPEF